MPLSDVINSFRTGPQRQGRYIVTRRTSGTYGADGKAIAPTSSTFPIQATVIPTPNNLLQVLPDGLRIEDTELVLTSTPLLAITPTTLPDRVDLQDGYLYEVITVRGPYQLGFSSHYEVIVSRQTIGGGS